VKIGETVFHITNPLNPLFDYYFVDENTAMYIGGSGVNKYFKGFIAEI
jgi:hypothetical protein